MGRAIVFERALRVGDTDLAAPRLDALARIAGAALPPALEPLAARGILRASAEACRESARRERGDYLVPLDADPAFAAPLRAAPSEVVRDLLPTPAAPSILDPTQQNEAAPTMTEAITLSQDRPVRSTPPQHGAGPSLPRWMENCGAS